MSSETSKVSARRKRKTFASPCLCLAMLLAAGLLQNCMCIAQHTCRGVPPPGFDVPSMASFRGEYTNSVYEYSVTIPAGLTGYSSPPPSPAHGFGVSLGAKKEGYLWVDGSWNSLEFESSEMAAQAVGDYLKKRGAIISESKVGPWKLGEFLASRVIVRYSCPGSGGLFVRDEVVALSTSKSKIWELGIDTPLVSYEQDCRILEAILKSWRRCPENR